MGTAHLHNTGAADEPSGENFGTIHGDCRVIHTVHDYGGARDLAQPIGDVITTCQALIRLTECLLRTLIPLGDPCRTVLGVIDDDRSNDIGEPAAGPFCKPHMIHRIIAGFGFVVVKAGLRIEEDQPAHPLGRRQCDAE